MSKPSTPRRSKQSKPVTIDLEAEDVTRAEEGSDGKDEVSTSAPQSPSSSHDRGAPAPEPEDKPEAKGTADDDASKTAASGLGVGSASDVKADKVEKPGESAASGLAAPQTGGRDSAKSTKPSGPSVSASDDKKPFDGKPTTGSPMGSASSAAAASKASSSTPSSSSSAAGSADQGASASAQKPSGPSRGGAIAGGVIGAALGIAALFGLQATDLLPAPGGSGTDTSALENEISGLKATIDDLRSSVAQAPEGAADLSSINSRLESLETAVSSGSTSTDAGPALGEFSTRLDQLSEKVDGLAGDGASGEVREQIAGLAGRVDDMSGSLSDVQGRMGEMTSRLDALETSQAELSASLTERIDRAEQAIAAPGREMQMAKAIAVSGLKAAIDRGGSFAPELEAYASVAPDDPAVSELREFAANGVPTQGELVERFPDAANAMIAAMNPVPEDAGVLDRLLASAKSVVKVRQVGDVEGDSTEAIAARLENQLKNGNLDGAVAEWNALPEQAKAAAPEFGKGLIARAEVEKLLTQVQLPAVADSQPELAPDETGAATDASEQTSPEQIAPEQTEPEQTTGDQATPAQSE